MPTRLTWTPDLIRKFWNGVAELPGLEHVSFAKMASGLLVQLFQRYLQPGMTCLDYGGGSGHLLRALIANGQKVAVYEPSDARAHNVEAAYANEPSFLGVYGPGDQQKFDSVTCIEVIEHVLDEEFPVFLHGLNRRLDSNGLLLLSTPYDEPLGEQDVYCPECDSYFHRWQHVRSFDAGTLSTILSIAGFDSEEIALVGFNDPAALEKYVHRGDGPWADNHIEKSGQVFPNVGAADHIFFAGRKRRAPDLAAISADLSRMRRRRYVWQAADVSASPINAESKAASLKTSVDVYLADETGIVNERQHILSNGKVSKTGNGAAARVAVFDGELTDLNHSPMTADVRAADEIHVRDYRSWRKLVRSNAASPRPPEHLPADQLARMREQVWESTARYLIQHPVGRRLQRYLDTNERRLHEVISHADTFPFRATHYAPGRIALGISSLASGGAERQTVYMAAGLKERGNDDVHLVVDHIYDRPANSFYLDKMAPMVRTIHEVGNDDLLQLPWVLENPGIWRILGGYVAQRVLTTAQHFQSLAPEVVQTSLDWTNVTMGLAALLVGVPRILISGRNLAPSHFTFFNWFMYPAYRVLAAQPNVILFNNSRAGGDDYADWLGISRDSVPVLRNAIDTSAFKPATDKACERARRHFQLKPEAPVIVGAFRLSAEKRPLLWVDAAAEVLKRIPNAQFLLFGDGPMSAKVQMRIHRNNLGDHVRVAGIANDIRFAFAAADLVLLTSLQEGTPNVLIEAQAMGLPVVTPPAFGAAEAVEDNGTGRIVQSAAAGDLADAVVDILSNAEVRERMKARGPAWAEQQFGAKRMIDDMLALHARIPLHPPIKS